MKVLVLAEEYSTRDKISQAFIHTRNCEYIRNGINVDVISFSSKVRYKLDDIEVFSEEEFNRIHGIEEYDIIISHAPNIRNHCRFIKKNAKKIKKLIFFFHGHEVLISKEVYPKPYEFIKKDKKIKELIRNLYDRIKLIYMTLFLKKFLDKSIYIFVSEWMYEQFKKNIKIRDNDYKEKSYIIYNSMGKEFLEKKYDVNTKKEYDFITIRNILDVSKYCIDLVIDIAKKYPQYKFLVVGKGEIFKHILPPKNLYYELRNLKHNEIIEYLNKSKYALMPTKADAQGVMMCEMATFGIPVITSDISVCRDVLGDLNNVRLIPNDISKIDLEKIIRGLTGSDKKCGKFSYQNTIKKEIDLIKKISKENE